MHVVYFLFQKYEDSGNNFPSWVIISFVSTLCLSVLISQYIPTVPKFISDWQVFDYQINKFGFCFISLSIFYLLKASLGYLFYQSSGDGDKWSVLYFTSRKFYFILSLIIITASIVNYYFFINKNLVFTYYLVFFAFIIIFKQFFYLFHTNKILPEKWYYKFLYICTLQIAPLLALWRLLFF